MVSNCKKEFVEPQIKITKFEIHDAITVSIPLPDEPLDSLHSLPEELIL